MSGIAHALRVLTSRLWLKHLDQSPATHKGFSKMRFSFSLAQACHQRMWRSLAGAKCVHACCLIVQACISHYHRKWPPVCFDVPAEFFIIPTISGDSRHQTNTPPIHIRMCTDSYSDTNALLLLCNHPQVLSTQSLATKFLLECRTSIY